MFLGSMTRRVKFHTTSRQIKSLRVKHVSRRDVNFAAIALDVVVSDELQAVRSCHRLPHRQRAGNRLTHDHTEHRERCLS